MPAIASTDVPDATLLVTLAGPDRPGITARLMGLLDAVGAHVDDVEQVVVRRQLVLGVVVRTDGEATVRTELARLAADTGLQIDIEPVDATPTERQLGAVVTLMAAEVQPVQIGAVAHAVAGAGGNIDRIVRLARYPVTAYELTVLGATVVELRRALADVSRGHGLDIAIQPEGLGRRAQRLVVMDVDSTLIQDEIIELLADEAGCGQAVRAVTERAMRGEIDFAASLRERVRCLAGLDTAALDRARSRVRLTPGARTFVRTLRRLGFRVAIVSGGFTFFTDRLAAELQLDHAFANELEIVDGRLTGEVVGPVVDRRRKAELLRQVAAAEGIDLDQTVAVGDGANDLDMLAAAGLGVAFNAKPVVRDAADTSVSVPYLDAILFVLGVRRSEVEAADDADGVTRIDPPLTPA